MVHPNNLTHIIEHRLRMCEECMSETCAYVDGGVCRYPLIFGTLPGVHEDGCAGYVFKESDP